MALRTCTIHPNTIKVALAACCLAFAAGPVPAAALCQSLETLIEKGRANFPEGSNAQVSFQGDPAQLCTVTTGLSGRRDMNCRWEFGFRAPEADTAFAAIKDTIDRCFETTGGAEAAAGVNHPDTYTQHQVVADGIPISVSLKDKGALQKTYIFLRVSGALAN